jgi:hypothetical protein
VSTLKITAFVFGLNGGMSWGVLFNKVTVLWLVSVYFVSIKIFFYLDNDLERV